MRDFSTQATSPAANDDMAEPEEKLAPVTDSVVEKARCKLLNQLNKMNSGGATKDASSAKDKQKPTTSDALC